MTLKTPTDQDAHNARGILETIADCRRDGDYERADTMIREVALLPAESLHILIDVAAALAVTVRDIRGPHAPETARGTAGDQ